jgi:hypothetical protein
VSEADCFWNWARGLAPVEHSGPPRKDIVGGEARGCCYCCFRAVWPVVRWCRMMTFGGVGLDWIFVASRFAEVTDGWRA